jgi:hypothetical protein
MDIHVLLSLCGAYFYGTSLVLLSQKVQIIDWTALCTKKEIELCTKANVKLVSVYLEENYRNKKTYCTKIIQIHIFPLK